jgi:STAS-like domain of unknown function (DUF4325)/Winged helix-turn-helix DNA-binding
MTSRLQFPVGQQGSYLVTRSSARMLREGLERRIEAQPGLEEITIDFSGVEAMTISFADEFIGRFYAALADGSIPPAAVALTGLTEETREEVTICLERRDLIAVDTDQQTLLGRAEVYEATYQAALRMGAFRATELADTVGISPQNANNRLKKLTAAGALVRRRLTDMDRGGKEFGYSVP